MTTLHGPYVQELLTYRGPAMRRMVLDASELGCTAIATNVWASVPGSVRGLAHPTPFARNDFAQPKPKLWQNIDRLFRFADWYEMQVIFYGLMWPDIWFAHQRHHEHPEIGMVEYLESFQYSGVPCSLEHFRTFSGPVREGWLNFWAGPGGLVDRYGSEAWYVDGTEVYMSAHGQSPNQISLEIAAATPDSARLYASKGPNPSFVANREEAHINPGDVYSFAGEGGIIATDGWGHTPSISFRVEMDGSEDRWLSYPALPPGENVKQISDWYVNLARRCDEDRRDACLVLHTSGWEVDRPTMWPRRQGRIWRKGDQPWHRIYARMSEALAA